MSPVAERKQSDTRHSAKQLPHNDLVVRCVVFKNNHGEYSAECIDLDLLVYGRTTHDALHSLKDAMMGYLAVAWAGDASGLVPRKAPLSHRVRYHFYALRAALTNGTRRNFLLNDWSPSPSPCKAR